MFHISLLKNLSFKSSASASVFSPMRQTVSRRILRAPGVVMRRSAYHSGPSPFIARTKTALMSLSSVVPRLSLASAVAFVSFSSVAAVCGAPLRNDAVMQMPTIDVRVSKQPSAHKSRFNGYLDYRELCIGSMTGLVLGVVIGKFSSALVFLSLASYFLIQFLEANNIVVIPWKKIVRVGTEDIELKQLVLSNPSFKLSFVSSFLIAAFNI